MLPDVRLLVLTDRPGGGTDLLPSLEYLGHDVSAIPLDSMSLNGLAEAAIAIVDATTDLREATAACRTVSIHDLRIPVLVVVPEAALAALKPTGGSTTGCCRRRPRPSSRRGCGWSGPCPCGGRDARPTAVGDLVIDEDSYQVRLRGEPLDLTFKEFELLKMLAAHPNRVFTRELLLQEVWGYDYFGGSRTVDVHIRRLRAKLGPEHESLIVTVRGVGYKLVPAADRHRRD
jgi:DNA-binding winged helix-turn-helix (wHTH) protein